jgi:hypothetical protein
MRRILAAAISALLLSAGTASLGMGPGASPEAKLYEARALFNRGQYEGAAPAEIGHGRRTCVAALTADHRRQLHRFGLIVRVMNPGDHPLGGRAVRRDRHGQTMPFRRGQHVRRALRRATCKKHFVEH